jgi:hypothetical protein
VFGGSSSFSIIESMQQVVVDIRMYLLYLLLMMWGFACAYCVLFRRDQEHEVRCPTVLLMFMYCLWCTCRKRKSGLLCKLADPVLHRHVLLRPACHMLPIAVNKLWIHAYLS